MQFDFSHQIKQKTDKELTDIFTHAGDYNPDFVKLAEEELRLRNISVESSKQKRELLEQTAIDQLKEGKDGNPLYIFLCFILAIFGGLLGIYAGYVYSQSKIKANDGESYYAYNKETRQLGKIMIGVGIAAIIIILVW